MANENVSVGQELLNVPMGEMIRSMALGIAEAQWDLDKSGMTVAELMSGQRLLRDLDTGQLIDGGGNPLKDGREPQIVDSRVYFGYDYVNKEGKLTREPQKLSMMELGFTPTFYQFVDTIIEVKIAIKMTSESTSTRSEQQRMEVATKKDVTVPETTTHRSRSSSWWGSSASSTTQTRQKKVGERTTARASSVDASYSSKFSFSAEGSSLLRTKLVPVPPPAILEERIRDQMKQEAEYRDLMQKKNQ